MSALPARTHRGRGRGADHARPTCGWCRPPWRRGWSSCSACTPVRPGVPSRSVSPAARWSPRLRGAVGPVRPPQWSSRRRGAALAAGLVVTAHTLALHEHPLRAAAERGAAATLTVVVRDDPHALRSGDAVGRPGAAQVLVPATLRAAETGGRRWTGGGRVLLIAPAAGWSALLPGQEVGADGLLAPATRADLTVAVLRVRGAPHEVGPAPWWQTGAGALRDGLRAAAAVLPEAPAGLLPGLAVGDIRGLPDEVRDDFRAAGLSHLTAVSGSNLAIVAGAVLGLLRLLRADPRLAAALSAAALLGFVVLARPSPSVLRAAVMGGVVLLALALGRARSAVPALAAAVLGLLLVDPALATDPGFGLSVLATAALVLIVPGWAARMRRRGVPPGRGRGAGRARGGLPRDGTADRRAERRRQPGGGGREPARGARGGAGDGAGCGGRGAVPGVGRRPRRGVPGSPDRRWAGSSPSRTGRRPCPAAWFRGRTASPGPGCSPWSCSRSWRSPAPGGSVRCSSRRSSACCWCSCPPGCCARAGRRRAGPWWRATSGRATRWSSRPGSRGGRCWSTPARATDRWTPAWTGSGSPRWRSCWSATCTRTTSAASPGRCAAGRSARSPSDRSGSRGGPWSGSRGRRPRPARGWSQVRPGTRLVWPALALDVLGPAASARARRPGRRHAGQRRLDGAPRDDPRPAPCC